MCLFDTPSRLYVTFSCSALASMKKVLIVILCVMFHIQYVVGQCHIIEGDYVRDKSYEFITIKGNRLYYIERQPHLSIRNSDTLAICDVRIIEDHVIEINSTYKEEVERNMMITQVVGDEMVDSIDIKFDFPYSDKQNPWKMQVYYNITASPLESYDFHIKIPADSKGFFFEVFGYYIICRTLMKSRKDVRVLPCRTICLMQVSLRGIIQRTSICMLRETRYIGKERFLKESRNVKNGCKN